jgi:glutaredoxin
MTRKLIFYTKDHCSLCDLAEDLIELLKIDFDFEVEKVDIYQDDQLLEKYQLLIPVVEVDGKQVDVSGMDYNNLRKLFTNE